jgi:glucokinase
VLLLSHYGRAAADCALTFLPFGGLYVTGGVALKNRKYMETPKATAGGHSSNHSYFFNGYWHNHKMDSLLKTIPLFLVEREDMGMRGAIKYAEIIFEATQYAAMS